MAKYALLLFLPVFLFLACEEEEDYPFSPEVVLNINGTDSIAIIDTIVFVTNNGLAINEVEILSEPVGANLYTSVDGRKFEATDKNTFMVPKEDSVFQFYLKKKGFERSGLYTLIFSEQPAEFLTSTQLYPNPADLVLNLKISNKTRGVIEMKVLDISGRIIFPTEKLLKVSDLLEVTYDVHNLQKGMYLLRVKIGNNVQHLKFFKL